MTSKQTDNFDNPFLVDRFQLYKGNLKTEYGPGVLNGLSSNGNGFVSNGYGPTERKPRKRKRHSVSDDSESEASYDSAGKQKSFHRVWVRFAEKTSMQGVPYIHTAKLLWAKIAWAILTIVAIAAMVLHLYYLIDQFYQWPMTTKISLGFNSLHYPDVTICNTNIIKRSQLQKLQGAKELKAVVAYMNPSNLAPDIRNEGNTRSDTSNTGNNMGDTGSGTGNTGSDTSTTGSGIDNTGTSNQLPQESTSGGDGNPPVRRKRFLDKHNNFDFDGYGYKNPAAELGPADGEFDGAIDPGGEIIDLFTSLYMDLPKHEREMIGHNITDMLVSCTFNGRTCGSELFRLYQTSAYGNCWTISSDKFIARTSGPEAGLKLVLFMEASEYIPGISNGYGARLTISEPGTFPFPSDEGLDISSSMETSIGLKMLTITRLGKPYSDGCEEGTTFAEKYNTTYSRRACQTVCKISALLESCGCFEQGTEQIVTTTRNSSIRPCRSDTEKECMLNTTRKFESFEIPCHCLNPCQETQYVKSWSQRQWPSDSYADVLLQESCEKTPSLCDTMKQADGRSLNYNFLKLNIYYEDLNFEKIEEDPEIEITQFLSDVGGAIGLWIGLSVLAFCEIFQLIVELIDYGIHRLKKKRRRERRKEKEKTRKRKENIRTKYDVGNFGKWPQTELSSPFGIPKSFRSDERQLSNISSINIPRREFREHL